MDTAKHWEHLERLSEADEVRVIQIIPKVPPADLTPDFVEHMQRQHNRELAGRFVFVLLGMLHFYPQCIVYVEADHNRFYRRHPGLARDVDVHDFPQVKMERYIRAAMRKRGVRVAFHFTELDILIRLTGGLDNEIYGQDPDFDSVLSRLVAARGLFLETYKNIWNEKHL